MTAKYVGLRKFNQDELIFDKVETIIILQFIFRGYVSEARLKTLNVTDHVREFAQGLLVEAVDASYAMGFIEAIFKSSVNPSAGAKKILKKFGKKALKHWFKHASPKGLLHVKIYEIVRKQLAVNFQTDMLMMLNGIASIRKNFVAYIDYSSDQEPIAVV
jgi:hypothetical protein